jgi:hypothetical protein
MAGEVEDRGHGCTSLSFRGMGGAYEGTLLATGGQGGHALVTPWSPPLRVPYTGRIRPGQTGRGLDLCDLVHRM